MCMISNKKAPNFSGTWILVVAKGLMLLAANKAGHLRDRIQKIFHLDIGYFELDCYIKIDIM